MTSFARSTPSPKTAARPLSSAKVRPPAQGATPLTEGVTPDGPGLNMTITAEVNQYGGFVELTDILLLTAIDNNLVQAASCWQPGRAGPWTPSPARS